MLLSSVSDFELSIHLSLFYKTPFWRTCVVFPISVERYSQNSAQTLLVIHELNWNWSKLCQLTGFHLKQELLLPVTLSFPSCLPRNWFWWWYHVMRSCFVELLPIMLEILVGLLEELWWHDDSSSWSVIIGRHLSHRMLYIARANNEHLWPPFTKVAILFFILIGEQ